MDKTQIPEETELIVFSVDRHYTQKRYRVRQLQAIADDAPYRTTLVATKTSLRILVEAQKHPRWHGTLEKLARWLSARREYCELYLATDEDSELTGSLLKDLRREGVGLLLVNEAGHVHVQERARNPALVVTPAPGLSLGPSRNAVAEALNKFNGTDRKDGLRDMCEIVEGLTADVLVKAARRCLVTIDEATARNQDWSTQINSLASNKACKGQPIIDKYLKDDLHSFRTGRNLVDHAATGRREDARRQRQYADKMMMGPRLVSELETIKRRLLRRRNTTVRRPGRAPTARP